VTQSTMRADLLQAFEIITHLRIDAVGKDLGALAVDDVSLPVQEPGGDFELCRVLDDCNEALKFIGVKLSRAETYIGGCSQ
jgi:hypothetical protein